MPHMANLPWLPLFMLFNLSLMAVICSMKTCLPTMKSKANKNYKSNKKWQW